jgi:hypothetical protein
MYIKIKSVLNELTHFFAKVLALFFVYHSKFRKRDNLLLVWSLHLTQNFVKVLTFQHLKFTISLAQVLVFSYLLATK